ncbi:MAG: hypothetical protein KAU91_01445, partial [Candidatus Aminicenantes bacterium]|nr:hypothetical protein [Candidatus Aminicenantes bacterium]
TLGEYSLSGYGSISFVKRPVRTRMMGVVGRGREKLPLTRYEFCFNDFPKWNSSSKLFRVFYWNRWLTAYNANYLITLNNWASTVSWIDTHVSPEEGKSIMDHGYV